MKREQNFLKAARTGDLKKIIGILNDRSVNIDLNHADDYGNTALIIASENGYVDIVHALLDDDRINPNHADDYGNTALIIASENGYVDIVHALLDDDRINPNLANRPGNTALLRAAYAGCIDLVRMFLADARIDPNHANRRGLTALTWAASAALARREDIVRELLADERVNPNHDDIAGNTALLLATYEGQSDIVRVLLAVERVNPNHANHMGVTALIWAAQEGYTAIVDILLTHACIDLSYTDQAKKAMMKASEHRHDKTLRLLLKFSGQRLSDDDLAKLADSDRGFYKRITSQVLWARLRGIVRLMVIFRHMRLRAAEAIYTPGGAGYAVAADRFASAAASQEPSSGTLTIPETNSTAAYITRNACEPDAKKRRI